MVAFADPTEWVAYLRVSTQFQEDSGRGIQAQRIAIETECSRRHWPMPKFYEEMISTRDDIGPQFERALLEVCRPDVRGLIVAKLDRLGRSVFRLSSLMERSVKEGWELVILDPPVDSTTIYGKAMLQMAGVFAELERGLIAERTSAAIQAGLARGETWGPKPELDPNIEAMMREWFERGWKNAEVVQMLNSMGVPAARGGLWQHAAVNRVRRRYNRLKDAGVLTVGIPAG